MSSDNSDVESPILTNKKKQTKKDETQEPKLNTKEMIHEALKSSKNRKGISLYAIKKYMEDNYETDTKKISYLIKKQLKDGVENGTILQTKGIGASGSFRLTPGKKSGTKKLKTPDAEITEPDKESKKSKKVTKTEGEKKPKKTAATTTKPVEKGVNIKKSAKGKLVQAKDGDGMKTPVKKKSNMVKRKSIGSIIKRPKMKPRAEAS